MHFLNLPNELVTLIAEHLDEYCINALLQTCRRFFLLLNRFLYEHNVCYSSACSLLLWAAQKGYASTAQFALEAGASPNAVPTEGWVPMALACIHGHEAVVRLLLDRGVDPNSTEGWFHGESAFPQLSGDDYGCPMTLAAGRGHEHVIRLLLSYGASPDIDLTPLSGDIDITPLSVATRQGHLSIVKLFVELGCDVHLRGRWGPTILSDAAYEGHCGVVRFLLETDPDIESSHMESFPALSMAASQGHIEIVDLLLDHSKRRTPRMEIPITPLVRAAQGVFYTVTDRSAQGKFYAVTERLRRAMDLEKLIARGEPDDDDHKQLFFVSAACGWGDLIEKLLERGFPIDPDAQPNPLVCAVDCTHKRLVNTLLDHGADPNHRIRGNQPVLFGAVHTPELFQLLLDRGADPKSYAKNGESVLIRALRTGSLAAVEILQGKIPFEDPPRAQGACPTSLLEAAALGGVSMIEYLLDGPYRAVPGSAKVERALGIILSRADTASLSLLFQRRLIRHSAATRSRSLIGMVDSPSGDSGAVAATLDTLLAHGIEVDEGVASPLTEVLFRKRRGGGLLDGEVHFQLLLDRGADPLRARGISSTPLEAAAGFGHKKLVRVMLKSLVQRRVPLDELQQKLAKAEDLAKGFQHHDVIPLLRRFYWRKKYQDMPTS